MASVSQALRSAKGTNTHRHHKVPSRLNSRCPIAVRLAATLPLSEAIIGVIVVPMLLPNTRAHARSNVIQPFAAHYQRYGKGGGRRLYDHGQHKADKSEYQYGTYAQRCVLPQISEHLPDCSADPEHTGLSYPDP